MLQRAWQDAPGPRVLEAQRPAGEDDEPGALIIAERPRVVEAAGVHPKPADRERPGLIERGAQQERAEAAANELRDEPEIAQLGLVRRRRVELEIPGRHAAD